MKKIFYMALVISIVILAGCAREFQSETVVPNKIAINSIRSSFDRVMLQWNYPTGYPTPNISGYELYRSTGNAVAIVPANLLVTLPTTVNTYEDTTVAESTIYYYRLLYKGYPSTVVDISDAVSITTDAKSSVALTLSSAGSSPYTLSMKLEHYCPVTLVELRRVTGSTMVSLDKVVTSSVVVIANYLSGGTTFNYQDVSANAGTTYTYMLLSWITPSVGTINSNTITHTY